MSNWYEKSFGEDYLTVYKHRSRQDASREVAKLEEWLPLRKKQLILDLCCGMGGTPSLWRVKDSLWWGWICRRRYCPMLLGNRKVWPFPLSEGI